MNSYSESLKVGVLCLDGNKCIDGEEWQLTDRQSDNYIQNLIQYWDRDKEKSRGA